LLKLAVKNQYMNLKNPPPKGGGFLAAKSRLDAKAS
jgi:hypothetical protein